MAKNKSHHIHSQIHQPTGNTAEPPSNIHANKEEGGNMYVFTGKITTKL